jgi:hypothetical protein
MSPASDSREDRYRIQRRAVNLHAQNKHEAARGKQQISFVGSGPRTVDSRYQTVERPYTYTQEGDAECIACEEPKPAEENTKFAGYKVRNLSLILSLS